MLLPLIMSFAFAAGQGDPSIKLSLSSDVYSSAGDVAQVRVRVAQDGYVVILRAGVDGRIRVILPLDPGSDNFMRGGKDYGVRGRGDRDGFPVDNAEGTGIVLAAWSAAPFTYAHFVLGDHWDYRVLGAVPSDADPETTLLDIVREMAGSAHFDYDVAQYRVASEMSGYGHTHVSVGVGFGWGGWGYSPWTFGIGFGYGYGYGCWNWCWPYYGYGFYPYYGYGYYPYYGYGHYPYYGYGHAYYPYSGYPYYLHSPYTFKPGAAAGGGMIQPRPRTGGGFVAGFGGRGTSGQPGWTAPGFAPRTRTPSRVNVVDPRARVWDQARMAAGQHRTPPQSTPRSREQRGSGGYKSGGSSGGSRGQPHGGQAQPRSRGNQLSEVPGLQGRGSNRSYYDPRARSYNGRSYGGWGGFERRQPSSQFRGLEGGGFGGRTQTPGFSRGGFGGRSFSPGFSGGGFRGGSGGGARMSAPANGRHR